MKSFLKLSRIFLVGLIAFGIKAEAGFKPFKKIEKQVLGVVGKSVSGNSASKVPIEQVARDVHRLADSGVEIKESLSKKGASIDENEVGIATAAAYRSLRVGKLRTDKELTPDIVASAIESLGRLPINSEPDEGEVYIDGQKMENTTSNAFYMDPGPHKIRVVKGVLEKESNVVVKAGRNGAITLKLE